MSFSRIKGAAEQNRSLVKKINLNAMTSKLFDFFETCHFESVQIQHVESLSNRIAPCLCESSQFMFIVLKAARSTWPQVAFARASDSPERFSSREPLAENLHWSFFRLEVIFAKKKFWSNNLLCKWRIFARWAGPIKKHTCRQCRDSLENRRFF